MSMFIRITAMGKTEDVQVEDYEIGDNGELRIEDGDGVIRIVNDRHWQDVTHIKEWNAAKGSPSSPIGI